MTIDRRRFLTISAAAAVAGMPAQAHTWQGHAFGAEVSITLQGPATQTGPALRDALEAVSKIERLFSLYAPASALSVLNNDGVLQDPDPQFLALMRDADAANHTTQGLFDPTVQRLWRALANGNKPYDAASLIGWDRIEFDETQITLAPKQALTFNGIAQGFATDRVSAILRDHGLTQTLVNIGEHRGTGGPWRLGVIDPEHGLLGHRTLGTGAIATSSPAATPLGAAGHIVHPRATPQWSTVSVEAPTATQADALSTALVLAHLPQVHSIKARSSATRITLVDWDGNLTTL